MPTLNNFGHCHTTNEEALHAQVEVAAVCDSSEHDASASRHLSQIVRVIFGLSLLKHNSMDELIGIAHSVACCSKKFRPRHKKSLRPATQVKHDMSSARCRPSLQCAQSNNDDTLFGVRMAGAVRTSPHRLTACAIPLIRIITYTTYCHAENRKNQRNVSARLFPPGALELLESM